MSFGEHMCAFLLGVYLGVNLLARIILSFELTSSKQIIIITVVSWKVMKTHTAKISFLWIE